MSAIAYRKPEQPLEVLIRGANGIFLRAPVDMLRVRRDAAPDESRNVRKLLRDVIAFSQAKKK